MSGDRKAAGASNAPLETEVTDEGVSDAHGRDKPPEMLDQGSPSSGDSEISRDAQHAREIQDTSSGLDERGENIRIDPESHGLTPRQRTDAALQRSESRYRTLFESIDEGFCVIEMIFDDDDRPVDYRFLEANPAFVEQTGLVDVVGRRMRELAPGHEDHWFRTYGRVAVTGEPIRFVAPAEALHRWYNVYAFRIGEPAERKVAVLFTDVSTAHAAEREREQLLRELELERSRLAELFRLAPTFLAVVRGPDHVVELANEAYYQMVGGRPLIGKPIEEAIPEVRGQGFRALLDRVLETGEPYVGREVPIMLWRPDCDEPEERFLDFIYQPLVESDGTRSGVVAHGTDVTEQVRARRSVERASDRARNLQELTAALAATMTAEEIVDVVVTRGVSTMQATSGVIAILDMPAEDDPSAVSESAVIVRQIGLPDETANERFSIDSPGPAAASIRTGSPFFLESHDAIVERFPELTQLWKSLGTQALATVPMIAGGVTMGAVSFTWAARREIPAEDREFFLALGNQAAQALDRARLLSAERSSRAAAESAQRAAERARREADEANRAKSAFLATMSHEIRTPINAQIGYTQLMELGVAGPVTEQQRQYLARMTSSSEHLRALIDDVLDLAKIDAGGMVVAREFAMTGPQLSAAIDLVRPQADAKGIRLVDTRAGDDGEPFVGDEHRVRQILTNLLSNAVKFTDPGGTVSIGCGIVEETPSSAELLGEGPWTFIRVEDDGVGIAPEEQARVFDPFYQVDDAHTRSQGGTGLGLPISRRLARLAGGDLTLESEPGKGSIFTLWLPAAGAVGGTKESAAARGSRARRDPGDVRVHGLAEIGMYLRERVEDVLATHSARLRADPVFTKTMQMRRSELEDHQLTFLSDLAQTLVVIEETGGPNSDLLRDGSTIQRVIAELHGAMRKRLGWSEEQLEHEYDVLKEEISMLVRRRAADGAGDVSLALEVIEGIVDRARSVGLAALRRTPEPEEERGG